MWLVAIVGTMTFLLLTQTFRVFYEHLGLIELEIYL
jgi:hypothetical protein